MGSCSSQEPEPHSDGLRRIRTRTSDARTDRSSNFADARSQPSTTANRQTVLPTPIVVKTTVNQTQSAYPKFDPSTATQAQLAYYDAFSRVKLSNSRRNTLAALAGIVDSDLHTLSDAEIRSTLFAQHSAGFHELDELFHRAQVGETATPPGEVLSLGSLTELSSEGIQRLGALLSSAPRDEVTLLLLHQLGCREGPWILRHDTWQAGCAALCIVDRRTAIKAYTRCAEEYDAMKLSDAAFFEYYKFLFDFVKSPSARCISVEDAVTLWESVLVPRWVGGSTWCTFVVEHPAAKRGVFKDLWSQIVVFASTMTWPNCPEADMDTAWPSLIDSFVDECRHPRNATVGADKSVNSAVL